MCFKYNLFWLIVEIPPQFRSIGVDEVLGHERPGLPISNVHRWLVDAERSER